MKNHFFYCFIVFSVLVSCKKQITYDKQYPDLPAYSENGLDVGGVMINDTAWIFQQPAFASIFNPLSITSYPKGDSIIIIMNGQSKYPSLFYLSQIYIVLKNVHIEKVDDLIKLNGVTFIIDGQINYSGLGLSYQYKIVNNNKSKGQISFNKAFLDENGVIFGSGSANNPIILPYVVSGVFNIDIEQDRKYKLTAGRFDRTLRNGSSLYISP